jgi:methyl-accepting chemotaxis protein
MKLKTRIWMLPAVAAAVFAIAGAAVFAISSAAGNAIDTVRRSDYPFLDQTIRVSKRLDILTSTMQNAVAQGDKKLLADADAQVESIRQSLAAIRAIDGHQDDGRLLAERFDAYYGAAVPTARILLGIDKGDASAPAAQMQSALEALHKDLDATWSRADTGFNRSVALAHDGVRHSLLATLTTAVTVVAVLAVGSALLVRSVWRQIGGEPEYAVDVLQAMGAGDLSRKVEVQDGADSSLLAAVRDMAQGLASLVASVRGTTESIAGATRQIAVGNQDLSHRTEEQSGALDRTSRNLHSLNEAVEKNAHSVVEADRLAASSAAVARRGATVVAKMIETMRSVEGSSRRVSEIIGVIDNIAFQTNILALNAAVEAARAGDQGRGFAVVASEVRQLAQRSALAAREISGLIKSTVSQITDGSELIGDASQSIGEIVTSVDAVTSLMAEISAATREQAGDVRDVSAAVATMDQNTQQNAALVEQAAAAAGSLQSQAQDLFRAVSTFKLPGGPAARSLTVRGELSMAG